MSQYRYQKNQARICSELVEQFFRLERLSLSIINIYRVHILVCITCKPPSHLLLLYGIRYFIINANLMSNSMPLRSKYHIIKNTMQCQQSIDNRRANGLLLIVLEIISKLESSWLDHNGCIIASE